MTKTYDKNAIVKD